MMAKPPTQRGAGQRGGGGYRNHGASMARSAGRGGRPHAGGGGAKGGSCAVAALTFGAGLTGVVWGAVELVGRWTA